MPHPPINGLAGLSFADTDDDILVIGIDFGTTFSGIAWATVEEFKAGDINLITTWPGTGREEGKAPTELYYEDEDVTWGFGVPVDGDPVRWFKLLLLKEEDLAPELKTSEFLLRARRMLQENEKTAVNLIADYLRGLWTHVIETIERARGKSVVEALQFRVVITVPAIWKGYARQSMMYAAEEAGILGHRAGGPTDLVFAPEPEAAALSTLSEKALKPAPGDLYVICDAGGGTVDLISYEVASINPICLREAAEGTGGLCGGVFIDEAFERLCKKRLGRKWDHLSKTGIKEIMKGEWEYSIKPQFNQDPESHSKEYIVSIPAEAFGGSRSNKKGSSLDDTSKSPYIKNGRIHFTWSQIQMAFTDTSAEIGKLIDQQIGEVRKKGNSVTGVILVGGLGASLYLYQDLQHRYAEAGINVLQSSGIKPRTAICRGAVYKGFLSDSGPIANSIMSPIKVTSTISRASFGIVHRCAWVEGKHLEEDKAWDDIKDVWRANKQMYWFIKRGDNISGLQPVKNSYCFTYREDFGGKFSVQMSQCGEKHAPERETASVQKLCRIDCKLDVPFSALPTHTSESGKEYKSLDFELEMVPSGASVEFVVYVNGRKQGAQNAAVQFL